MNKDTVLRFTSKQIKDCLRKLNLEVIDEIYTESVYSVIARVPFPTDPIDINLSTQSGSNNILILTGLPVPVPNEKTDRIIDLVTRLNSGFIDIGSVSLDSEFVVYRSSAYIIDYKVDLANMTKIIEAMVIQIAWLSELIRRAVSEEEDLDQVIGKFMANLLTEFNDDEDGAEATHENKNPEEQITKSFIECLKAEDLTVVDRDPANRNQCESWFKDGANLFWVNSSYDSENRKISISISDRSKISKLDYNYLCHLFNELNNVSLGGHLVINLQEHIIEYKHSIFVIENGPECQLKFFLKDCISGWKNINPLVRYALETKRDPKALINERLQKLKELAHF